MKRKATFAIRTDHMSDRVYNCFETKSRNRELKDYLISLVERDLNGTLPDQSLAGSISEMKREMHEHFKDLAKKIENINVSSSQNFSKEYQSENEVIEGQVITTEDIKGTIDETYDLDF
ncbi:hypothetical protein IHV10_20025 [Fictibacillus sp. 5RED26]|uniref:hypothetical protein n=1 Tax=Fictibacillus sp. 5RED26 TaxID=2745876 RepID=UPI0018CE5896|nr:hypothetical protein [Fictibacillus sp. 5RED26]MBH0158674.1 hypothetical protein [Fictibacillus sp. 5RED26]